MSLYGDEKDFYGYDTSLLGESSLLDECLFDLRYLFGMVDENQMYSISKFTEDYTKTEYKGKLVHTVTVITNMGEFKYLATRPWKDEGRSGHLQFHFIAGDYLYWVTVKVLADWSGGSIVLILQDDWQTGETLFQMEDVEIKGAKAGK